MFFKGIQSLLTGVRNAIFGFVLTFFSSVNRRVRSALPFWRMEEETSEHVRMLVKVFKYAVFPASLFYVCADFIFFHENALDSMLWGILVFSYSSFLPDLPSIFRSSKDDGKNGDLPWYKKYSLLLFAPLFIWMIFSGMRIGWKTKENFHDIKSFTIFGIFLFLLGFLAFGGFPIYVGDMMEVLSLPLYGLIGYLSHLKVDKIL
jgi:hypothetical protein